MNNQYGCEPTVTITVERYEQLLRSESAAHCLLALIEEKYGHYQTLGRDELKMLVTMFIGIKED